MEAALSLKKKLEGEGKKVAIVQPYVPVKITKELYEFQDMEVLIHALLFKQKLILLPNTTPLKETHHLFFFVVVEVSSFDFFFFFYNLLIM